MRTMKTLALAAFAASALALAGCGGGGSKTSSVTPPTGGGDDKKASTPTDPAPAKVTLPTLPTGAAYEFALTGENTIAAGKTLTSGGVVLTCAAGGEDCVVTVADDDAVTATGGTVTATLTTAAATALENQTKTTAQTKTLRALGVADALAGTIGTESVTVSRKTSAAAAFKKTGYTAGDAPASAGAAWAGATLSKRNIVAGTDSSNMITVYSDIEAPETVAFGKVYGANPTHQTAARARYFVTPLPGTATDLGGYDSATRTLAFGTGGAATLSKAQAAFLDATHFPKVRGTTWQYNDKEEPTDEHPYSFDAKFHGAEGTYTCTPSTAGDDCTAERNASDQLILDGGTWTFEAKRSAKAVVTDVDYLTFGYWLQTPDAANTSGDYDYQLDLIATGSQPFLWTAAANDGIDTLAAGSAEYKGTAAGLYAVKTVEDGKTTAASHGSFLADASLTAVFTGGATGNMLSGEITSFRGGDTDMTDWSVGLNETAIAGSAGSPSVAVVTGGTAEALMGATKSKAGAWTAGLYGSGADRAKPTGVAGTFEADFDNAHIAGAFGARKQ